MKKTLVVLPSYNESENIVALMKEILAQSPVTYVCVVDDNSPDGTSNVVRAYMNSQMPELKSRMHLITRQKKDGRGGAVRDGLLWGLGPDAPVKFDALVEMDCDFSHPPRDLMRGVAMLSEADMVMGSRYPDGEIQGWPLSRRVMSFFANLLARTLISWNVSDFTNGYRFYTRSAAEFICSKPQRFKGYIYLSETIALFLGAGFRLDSFPIVFVNRKRGQSNTSLKEVTNAFKGIFQIAWGYRSGRLGR